MKTRPPQKILRFLRERGLWGCSATAVSLQVPGAIHTKNRAIFPFHTTVGRAKGHHTAEGSKPLTWNSEETRVSAT